MKLKKLAKWNGRILGIVLASGMLMNSQMPVLASDVSNESNFVESFEEIQNNQVLSQTEEEYYVYYYLEGCPDCEKAKPTLEKLAQSSKVYAVDYYTNASSISYYDWTQHYIDNDLDIGFVENGEEVFYVGESREKYENGGWFSEQGKHLYYDVIVADAEYLEMNPSAKLGHIYAVLETPLLDYSNVETTDDILIAGFPTVLHIKGGKIIGYFYDSPDIIENLGGK
ncbi:hypothetical protein FMM74_021400 [Lachnospiraceae bacterium MD308]|nr:hypothetical protein [Lachnospiraceae bacterium MD308]